MSRKHHLPTGHLRDSTPSGVLRARRLEVDKFNANAAVYSALTRLPTGLARGAADKQRPKMTAMQERARLRVSFRVILRKQPRWNRAGFKSAYVQRMAHVGAPQA
jgi:hypothetical protein